MYNIFSMQYIEHDRMEKRNARKKEVRKSKIGPFL